MKKQVLLFIAFSLAFIVIGSNVFAQSSTVAKTTKTKTTTSSVKTTAINTEKSFVGWVGKKVLGQHNGKVKLQSGTITTKGAVLTGGNFVIDMNTITCDDLTDQDYNKKLIGHLTSMDFFYVSEYPTAILKITKVLKLTNKPNAYNLTADLTVKGIAKSVTFPATFKKVGNIFEGNATITMDRTLWDIKYGSSNFFEGLGDKAIKNDIELKVYIASN